MSAMIDPLTYISRSFNDASGLRWPRGFRAGNPGNIEYNPKVKWQGLAGIEILPPGANFRPRFARFDKAVFGLRAIFRILIAYRDARAANGTPVDTIAEIIARWAPAFENNTTAYINAVDNAHPAEADDIIDTHYYEDAMPLAKAIVNHELGNPRIYGLREWYPQEVWDEAARLAGLRRRTPVPMYKDVAVVAPVVAGSATGIELAAPYIPMVKDLVQPGSVAANVLVAIAIAALVFFIYKRVRRRRQETV